LKINPVEVKAEQKDKTFKNLISDEKKLSA
jgi:hypothetical protein